MKRYKKQFVEDRNLTGVGVGDDDDDDDDGDDDEDDDLYDV